MFDFDNKKRLGQYRQPKSRAIISSVQKTTKPQSNMFSKIVTAGDAQVSRYNGTNQAMEIGNITNEWMPKDPAGQHALWRQIYMHCGVGGPAIDMISELPWSEFDLVGIEDEYLHIFQDSMDNLKIESLMSPLTKEYLTIGHTCSSLFFDGDKGVWSGLLPHDADTVQVTPAGVFCEDPLLDLRMSPAIKKMLTGSDERFNRVLDTIPASLREQLQGGGNIQLNPNNSLYLARKTFLNDHVGTSMLTRLVPLFALEQNLISGTLIASRRRQRSILHLTAGIDDVWEPSASDIDGIVQLFMQADEDPQGAIVGTPTGISIEEVRDGSNFWKVSDEADYIRNAKMQAMALSEAFMSGEANYNTADASMSIFIEQIRTLRDIITRNMFYYKMFPILSRAHGLRKINKSELEHRIKIKKTLQEEEQEVRSHMTTLQRYYAKRDAEKFARIRFVKEEYLKGNKPNLELLAHSEAEKIPQSELLFPQIHWRKELKPVSDSNYLDVLERMEQKGIPIPMKIWASAGGVDLKKILNGLDDDAETRKVIHDWKRGAVSDDEDQAFASALSVKRVVAGQLPLWGEKNRLLNLEKSEFEAYLRQLNPREIVAFSDTTFVEKSLHKYFQNTHKVEAAKLIMKRVGLADFRPDGHVLEAAVLNMDGLSQVEKLKEVQVITKRKPKTQPSLNTVKSVKHSLKNLDTKKSNYYSGL